MSSSKMPDEHYYTNEQIPISPELPDILLQFSKVVIRTQPTDVLVWSVAYFRALANGETPPVKERLETSIATQKTDTDLSMDLLKILHRQISIDYNKLRMSETSISSSVSNDNDNHSSTNKQTSCFARSRWAHVLALVDQLRLNTKLKKR
ncbi:unnamed protein product [Rotaria sp. Silwood2]|nr:unnamed protein product [Rotaria sp. Silwood2]